MNRGLQHEAGEDGIGIHLAFRARRPTHRAAEQIHEMVSRFTCAWGASAAILAAGCQFAFGDYSPGTGGSGVVAGSGGKTSIGGSSSTGGSSATGGTNYGDCDGKQPYRCSGKEILKCDANKKWALNDTCTDSLLCNTATGVCDKCVSGSVKCDGADLSICDDPLVGYTQHYTCTGSEYCDATIDHCVVCAIGEEHCELNTAGVLTGNVNDCNSDRTGWKLSACPNGCHQAANGGPENCIDCTASTPPVCSSSNGQSVQRFCDLTTEKFATKGCPGGCTDTPPSCF